MSTRTVITGGAGLGSVILRLALQRGDDAVLVGSKYVVPDPPPHYLIIAQRYRGDPSASWFGELSQLTAMKTYIEWFIGAYGNDSGDTHDKAIVLIGSDAGHDFIPEVSLGYHVVKTSLIAFARFVTHTHRVRCNVLSTGSLRFPVDRQYGIARLALWLCSKESSHISGQDILALT